MLYTLLGRLVWRAAKRYLRRKYLAGGSAGSSSRARKRPRGKSRRPLLGVVTAAAVGSAVALRRRRAI